MKLQLQTRLKKETEHRSKNRKELSSSRSKLSIFNQHLSSDQKVVGEVAVPALVSKMVSPLETKKDTCENTSQPFSERKEKES